MAGSAGGDRLDRVSLPHPELDRLHDGLVQVHIHRVLSSHPTAFVWVEPADVDSQFTAHHVLVAVDFLAHIFAVVRLDERPGGPDAGETRSAREPDNAIEAVRALEGVRDACGL